jgi:hypothetical protein
MLAFPLLRGKSLFMQKGPSILALALGKVVKPILIIVFIVISIISHRNHLGFGFFSFLEDRISLRIMLHGIHVTGSYAPYLYSPKLPLQ